MTGLSKFNRKVEKMIEPVIAVALLFITIMLFSNVIGRYVFGVSLKWAEEMTNYIIIWITFLGGVVCLRKGMQITMDAFVLQLKGSMQIFVTRLTNGLGLLFSLATVWLSYKLVMMVLPTGQVSPAMMVPMFIPYLVLPVSGLLMAMEYLELIMFGKIDESAHNLSS